MIEHKYQTFWPRIYSGLVDGVVFIPFVYLDEWIYSLEVSNYYLLTYYALTSLSFYIYSVCMHGYYGQTLGKMLLRIKLYSVTESSLGFKRALYRDAIVILFTIVFIAIEAPDILNNTNPQNIKNSEGMELLIFIVMIWYLSEFITMLFNNKRRAIHDYIAGSVVMRL